MQLQREHGRWRVFRQLWLVHPPPAEHRREALAWLGAVGAGQRVSGAPARAAGPR